jgi:hypothetical protein
MSPTRGSSFPTEISTPLDSRSRSPSPERVSGFHTEHWGEGLSQTQYHSFLPDTLSQINKEDGELRIVFEALVDEKILKDIKELLAQRETFSPVQRELGMRRSITSESQTTFLEYVAECVYLLMRTQFPSVLSQHDPIVYSIFITKIQRAIYYKLMQFLQHRPSSFPAQKDASLHKIAPAKKEVILALQKRLFSFENLPSNILKGSLDAITKDDVQSWQKFQTTLPPQHIPQWESLTRFFSKLDGSWYSVCNLLTKEYFNGLLQSHTPG